MPYDETPSPARPPRVPRPITGRMVLIMFVSFFGIVGAVNGVMMTLAIRTMPGLDVQNGYVASQAMNRELQAMRLQEQRSWSADVAVTLKARTAPVSISLKRPDGSPVSGLAMTARLAHPALTRADHAGALIEGRPGVYSVDLPDVQAGAWTLVIEGGRDGERVFASRNRVVLTEARP